MLVKRYTSRVALNASLRSFTLLVTVFIYHNTYASAITTSPQGFLWYNQIINNETIVKQPIAKNLPQKQDQVTAPKVPVPEWEKRIAKLKQQFETATNKALDNPTIENVIDAQRLQKQIIDKSAKFAQIWHLASLLDYRLSDVTKSGQGSGAGSISSSNSLHKRIKDQQDMQENAAKLKKLAKHWGVILQFDSLCQYCHAFAPIIKEFASKYGFQLLAVSKGGSDFAGIKGMRDNGFLFASGLNPEQIVPVLYLVSSSGGRIYPIARGIISEDQIVDNIIMIDRNYQRLDYQGESR